MTSTKSIPDDSYWQSLSDGLPAGVRIATEVSDSGERHYVFLGGVKVARFSQRVTRGTWFTKSRPTTEIIWLAHPAMRPQIEVILSTVAANAEAKRAARIEAAVREQQAATDAALAAWRSTFGEELK